MRASWWGQASLVVGSTKCFGAKRMFKQDSPLSPFHCKDCNFHFLAILRKKRNDLLFIAAADLEFVKKFTRPNFQVQEFYTLKTRESRLFSPAINSENASLSVIWPCFG